MRDDDDLDPDDEPKGRIFYSGINPDADRASYALPPGNPALQDGEPECEYETVTSPVEPQPMTEQPVRRDFAPVFVSVASGFAMATVFCVGFVFGWLPDRGPGSIQPVLNAVPEGGDARTNLGEWAHKLALGSVVDLIEYRLPFLAVVAMQSESADSNLWHGVRRLAAVALVAGPKERQAMTRDLLRVCDRCEVPAHLTQDIHRLRAILTSPREGR